MSLLGLVSGSASLPPKAEREFGMQQSAVSIPWNRSAIGGGTTEKDRPVRLRADVCIEAGVADSLCGSGDRFRSPFRTSWSLGEQPSCCQLDLDGPWSRLCRIRPGGAWTSNRSCNTASVGSLGAERHTNRVDDSETGGKSTGCE